MSLETPFKIRRFQRKLYTKAKQEPSYRFYALYDKICRADILVHADELAKANGGAPGMDNQSFDAIEAAGRGRWLADVRKQLIEQTYRPETVRRVMIPKPGGGERPLGIPTIRDATEGGTDPLWRRKGGELYYRDGDKLMVVRVSTSGALDPAKPDILWSGKYAHGMGSACGPPGTTSSNYDATADGSGFLMIKHEEIAPARIHVVVNWTRELKRMMSGGDGERDGTAQR